MLEVKENPLGLEELMILNPEDLETNPAKRRRKKGRKRKKKRGSSGKRRTVTVRVNQAPARRNHSKPRRKKGRARGRTVTIYRNPDGRVKLKDIPGLAFQGAQGMIWGAAGYYGSKVLLPPKWDRTWQGYTTHGLLGTLAAWGTTGAARALGFKGLRAAPSIIGVWSTVFFRIALNAPYFPVKGFCDRNGFPGRVDFQNRIL